MLGLKLNHVSKSGHRGTFSLREIRTSIEIETGMSNYNIVKLGRNCSSMSSFKRWLGMDE